MADSDTQEMRDKVARAQAERAVAQLQTEHALRDKSEAIYAAQDEAVQTDLATAVALQENERRKAAEIEASNARISANRSQVEASNLATERNLLRDHLSTEREQASNATFGFYLITCIVIAVLLALGVWYYTSQSPSTAANAGNAAVPSSATASMPNTGSRSASPAVVVTQPAPPVVVRVPSRETRVIVEHNKPASSTGNNTNSGRNSDNSTDAKADSGDSDTDSSTTDTPASGRNDAKTNSGDSTDDKSTTNP